MDNNININKPESDKLSKEKKIPDVHFKNETSKTVTTSASSDAVNTGRVARSKFTRAALTRDDEDDKDKKEVNTGKAGSALSPDPGCSGTGGSHGKGLDESHSNAEDYSHKTGQEESHSNGPEYTDRKSPEESHIKTSEQSRGERTEEPVEREEEDIEIDDTSPLPIPGVVETDPCKDNISGDENNLDDRQEERQEEDIEIDEPATDVTSTFYNSSTRQTEEKNIGVESQSIGVCNLSETGANNLSPAKVSNLSDARANKLLDTAVASVGNSEPVVKDSCSDSETVLSVEKIEVDDPAQHSFEKDFDKTQDSMNTDGKRFVDYKDKDFDTDSDFEDTSDSNSQQPARTPDASAAMSMGNIFTNRARNKKKDESSDESEDDGERPWRNDHQGKEQQQRIRDRQNLKPSSFASRGISRLKRRWSDQDTLQYRKGYPGKKDKASENLNLRFYQNRISSHPNGAFIDDIHDSWWDDLDLLERHHGYIQWLFPIRESGMNWQAQELQLHEAKAIQADKKAFERLIKSYEMMLNFYGLELVDRDTGEVARAGNWKQRFRHLNYSMHNYLRITRILKCLGEMGLEHYKAPFLRHMLHEAVVKGTLDRTLDSCYNYWIGTLRDDAERHQVLKLAEDLYAGSCDAD